MTTNLASNDSYSGGYSTHIIGEFQQRSLEREGRFFRDRLKPGMRVLDCGCGPGSMTVEIAQIVEPGEVIGIDLDREQFTQSKKLAGERGLSNVTFDLGNVYELAFEDESFDAVYMHAVLYHLGDPAKALEEARRVLKPGGVIGLRDVDRGGDICNPEPAELSKAWSLVERVFAATESNVFFGRTQKQHLRQAGFTNITASASYDTFSSPQEIKGYADYWIDYLSNLHRKLVLDNQLASEEEISTACATFQEWSDTPDAFFARARCEAVAFK